MKKLSDLDIYRIRMEHVGDAIRDALKNNDVPILHGLQSLATGSPLWTWTHGGAAIFSYLIRRTVEERQKKKDERVRWEKEKYPIESAEKEELYSDKVWFPLDRILGDAGRRFTTIITFLNGFEGMGLIEKENRNPPGYEDDVRGMMIALTNIWDLQLERLERKGEETEVFSEAIGRLAALSVLAIQGSRFAGLKPFKILSNICDVAAKNNRKIKIQECREIFERNKEPVARMYQMFSYDNQKVPGIRFVEKYDAREILIKEEAILANNRVNERAQRFIRRIR